MPWVHVWVRRHSGWHSLSNVSWSQWSFICSASPVWKEEHEERTRITGSQWDYRQNKDSWHPSSQRLLKDTPSLNKGSRAVASVASDWLCVENGRVNIYRESWADSKIQSRTQWLTALIPPLWRLKNEWFSQVQGYIVSSRWAWATAWNFQHEIRPGLVGTRL